MGDVSQVDQQGRRTAIKKIIGGAIGLGGLALGGKKVITDMLSQPVRPPPERVDPVVIQANQVELNNKINESQRPGNEQKTNQPEFHAYYTQLIDDTHPNLSTALKEAFYQSLCNSMVPSEAQKYADNWEYQSYGIVVINPDGTNLAFTDPRTLLVADRNHDVPPVQPGAEVRISSHPRDGEANSLSVYLNNNKTKTLNYYEFAVQPDGSGGYIKTTPEQAGKKITEDFGLK